MTKLLALPVLLAAVALADPALAYVGPGAGLSVLGALWGIMLATLAALAFIFLWPIRRLIRARRRAAGGPGDARRATGRRHPPTGPS